MNINRKTLGKRLWTAFACCCLVALAPVTARAGSLELKEGGVIIKAGNMGNFTLKYPVLDAGGKKKPIEVQVDKDKATIKYAGGTTVTVALEGDGKIAYRFSGETGSIKSLKVSGFTVPFHFIDGGTWKIGKGAATPFPPEKPEKPFLFQGNASSFELTGIDGKRISITVPDYTYQQLQDNREWNNNKTFGWWFSVPFNKDWDAHRVTVNFDTSDMKTVVLCDKFGQTTKKDFPGKIKSEDELKADAKTEQAYYDSLTPPKWNPYGGLPGSGEKLGLEKTGFFHVEKKGERWYLVDPSGDAFFHLGICGFVPGGEYTYIEGRESVFEWLPPHDGEFAVAWHPEKYWNSRAVAFYLANIIRKYGSFDKNEYMIRMIDRVRRMGFNSVGAFSGHSPAFAETAIPRAAHLPLGGLKMVPGVRGVFDPFDDGNLKKIADSFAKHLGKNADNPLIIGYFLANEQGFEDIPRAIPALNGKYACKRRLVEMLKDKYKDIAAFNVAWNAKAQSFDALADQGLPLTTKSAFADMQAYNELFLDAYYKCITDEFRKNDGNHMLIGNRWQPGTSNSEPLCRIAGKYMDVISINYYTTGIDEQFIRRLYKWTGGKPQMWSEFYFTAEKESNAGGANDVPTQKDRGLAYRNYVESAASLGFVVGVEWFTLIDQSVTGRWFERYNGERNNTGLFNVCDRPYKDMIAEMMKAHAAVYDVWLGKKEPYKYDNPRFNSGSGTKTQTVHAGRPTGPMKIDGLLEGWPGRPPERIPNSRLAIARENTGLEAVFKACWDDGNLYLLVNVTDATPMMNEKEGGKLWSADGVELFFGSEKIDQPGPFIFTDRQVLVGAGKADQFHVVRAPKQPAIKSVAVPAVDGKGYILEIAVPWSALAVEKPKEGMEFLFDLGVDDSKDGNGRSCQIMWNGIARNSSDRGRWGRLKLER